LHVRGQRLPRRRRRQEGPFPCLCNPRQDRRRRPSSRPQNRSTLGEHAALVPCRCFHGFYGESSDSEYIHSPREVVSCRVVKAGMMTKERNSHVARLGEGRVPSVREPRRVRSVRKFTHGLREALSFVDGEELSRITAGHESQSRRRSTPNTTSNDGTFVRRHAEQRPGTVTQRQRGDQCLVVLPFLSFLRPTPRPFPQGK
jgi:hypothetical protein